jgi:hypothetical protein
VGLLTSGALAIHSTGLMPARLVPPGPPIWGVGSGNAGAGRAGVVSTLLGPEETGTGTFGFRIVLCPQPLRVCFAWSVERVRACGPVRPPYRIFSPGRCRVVGCWWWLRVGVRSCFENCIVNASIL